MNALIPFSASSRPRLTILFFLLLLLGNLTTQAQNNWTGATDRAWNTAGNWSAGIPTAGSDVVIPSTPTNQPIISTAAVARTVEVQSGALLTISNSGSLTINGSKSVGGVNPTTGFYNGGSVLNQGAVVLGNQSSVGQYGLANVASFSNTSGGSISIDRAIFCGLFNRDGSFVNTSRLIIGGLASVGQYGLINSASFSNTSSGSISIDRTSAGGLLNDRAIFVNSARITIGASATVGADGLHNNGLFSNTEGGNISIDRASNIGLRNKDLEGSVNTTGGSFVNSATITIGASVTGIALDNRSVVGSGSQNVPVFNNQGCSALLQSLGNAVITNTSPASFSNTGTIIENTSDNSSISYNGGLVQNLNGGTFNVTGTNTGVVTTTPEPPPTITATPSLTITQGESATLTASGASSYSWSNGQSTTAISVSVAGPYSVTGIIGSCSSVASVTLTVNVPVCGSGLSGPTWTGCVSTDWSTAGNWASGALPTASDDVVIPAAPANQPVLSTTATAKSVEVQTGASLSITVAGSLTLNGSKNVDGFPTAFSNRGMVQNAGLLILGNTADVGAFAIWNRSSFTNNGGEIRIDRTTNQGINNNVGLFTNTGTITIGALASVGQQGILNQAAFSNTGGTITIDRTTDNGLLNSGNFTNSATITIGATAAVGSSGLYNLATFANQAGGRIQIDNSTGTGLFNALGSRFTNSAMLIIGASAAVGLYGLYNRPNATFENQAGGYIQLDNSTYVGLYNPGETFINSGTITIGSLGTIGGTGIRNEGPFANRACATLTVLAPIINSNSFTNAGLFTVNTSQAHTNTGALTNNGIIDYPQGNPIPNVVNNDVIAAPISSCGSLTITPALQLGPNNNQFMISGKWYKDQALTQEAGNYVQGTNTFTATSLSIGSSTTLYFAATDNANSCTKTISISVTLNALPTPTLVNSGTLTCAQTSVTLTASGGTSYTFTDGGGTVLGTPGASNTLVVSNEGAYSVLVANASGCTATTSTTVVSSTNAPALSISPSSATLTCTNPAVSLTAVGSGMYRWNNGATTSVISATSADTYSVTLTGANGCTATASIQLSLDNTPPALSINPSIGTPTSATLTCTNPLASLSAVGSGSVRWSTGATTSVISATSAGTYSVTLTGANGCRATASIQVAQDIAPPVVSVTPGSATLTCTNTAVSLTAVGTGTYRWSTGATSQVISVTSANTYSVTLTGSNGCTATTSVVVSVDQTAPTVTVNPASATLTCTNPAVSLTAVGTGTYRWSNGATTQIISATSANTYSVTLTGTNGCTAATSAQVLQNNTIPSITITANPSLTINPSQSTTLTATGATTYQWNTGATTSAIVVNVADTYSVTGTTGSCSATASVTVLSPFAISSVIANSCQQITANRYVISFTPKYIGLNGQPVSFSIANEIFPTTDPGPYTLQLYTDNPALILHAQQTGTPGEATYTYNWLAICQNPQPNTAPRVNQPLIDQVARVGQGFGYTLPQTTFTDNESPRSLSLSVSGLPAGLSFSPPTQIGGVPTVAGTSSVTVTAKDPGGLTVAATFVLTVVDPSATNTPPTLANPVADQVAIQGQPFGLSLSSTFTDAQTPQALALAATGLPTGLTLVGATIGGTPSQTGTSTITLIVTDPGGLTATTSFGLTVQPSSATASAPFAITGVNPLTCTQIASNRYDISFQPRYSGITGQVISFEVAGELAPTTAPGPYSLQLYNDKPTIVLKAKQTGSTGEASFTYNWLFFCQNPQPNTPPRVNQPLTDQVAKLGEGFGYSIPQLTFTDNESPQSLSLSVSGLPAGLSFSPPTQIGGVANGTGVSTVTVTATDPQGLTVSTTFTLRVVDPNNCRDGSGAITSVKAGSWNDPAVWSCGVIPGPADVVQINHLVSLPTSYVAQIKTLRYGTSGKLTYQSGAKLRLGF